MIIFSLDSMPKTKDILYCNDYSGKVVYTAISDPLFKINNERIEKNSCKEYKYSRNYRNLYITVRDDLYSYKGIKVYARDFVNLFNKILNSKSHVGLIFQKNFKGIQVIDKYRFCLILKYPNQSAHKILSIFNTGCLNFENSFGPYYIKKYSDNRIVLCRNNYYRKKINNKEAVELRFKLNVKNNELEMFLKNKLDITNNTKSDFICNNYIKEKSNIFINISFSPKILNKKNLNLRKTIMNCIEREKINSFLINPFECVSDFMGRNDKRVIKKTNEKQFKCKLTLGYNDFYPNGIIADQIKKQLLKYNIIIELIKNEFNIKNECDLNLTLSYLDYDSIESVFNSPYYDVVIKSIKYDYYLKKYNRTNDYKYIKKLNNILLKNVAKIPLLKLNSYYLKNSKLEKFSYVKLNYDEL